MYQVYKVYLSIICLKVFININPLLIVFYTPRCYTYHINYIQSGEGYGKEVQTDVTKNIENIETQRIEPTQLEVVQNDALTIEEIETGLVYNGSMVRVADISEEFRKVIEPILRMYNAAMNVTTARIEIIKDESRYKNMRCPVHHIDTRLKSAGSILGKLQKKNLDLTIGAACNNIYDIAGVRIVCPYIKDVYFIRDRILAQDDIEVMKVKDYIEHPKENGYRSYHLIIRVPVFL